MKVLVPTVNPGRMTEHRQLYCIKSKLLRKVTQET